MADRKEKMRELKIRKKDKNYIYYYAEFINKIMEILSLFIVREVMACCLISDADCLIDFTMHTDEVDKLEPFRR